MATTRFVATFSSLATRRDNRFFVLKDSLVSFAMAQSRSDGHVFTVSVNSSHCLLLSATFFELDRFRRDPYAI